MDLLRITGFQFGTRSPSNEPELEHALRKMLLKLRIAWRARTFKRGREMGMPVEEARTYTDYELPLTAAEAAYEREMDRKSEIVDHGRLA